jgi:serine/threonine protein kinase
MAPPGETPRSLGDFDLLRQIGRGGMGTVYEARQRSLNRRVALKVLNGGLGLSGRAVQRFRREAEAAARLHHTNIVPVYTTGEADGAHFYAMELVDGPSLDQVLARLRPRPRPAEEGAPAGSDASSPPGPGETVAYSSDASARLAGGQEPLPAPAPASSSTLDSRTGGGYFDTVARMTAEVAEALDYAHGNAVIHRDIKPSNLLLSPDGRLSLNDFGLARVLEQPGITMTGEFVGTPMYMSPEQIAAGRAPLDHRTDIYSLGATLYELLTLQPPFSGERRDQVIAQILHKEPRPPRRINKRVPVDLETICLKALEKDPERRYQTAGAMAEDLRRYLDRYAIAARRTGPVGRLVKWSRRNPYLAAATVAVVLAVSLAGAFAAHAGRVNRQLAEERCQGALDRASLTAMSGDLDAADAAIAEAERLGASTGQVRMLRGQVALHRGETAEAVRNLEQAVRLRPESVAAHAMLATTYAYAGDFARVEPEQHRALRLPAQTAEDLLYRGHMFAAGATDPARGLADMDAAIRRRDSPVARVLRAMTRAFGALDRADAAMAELALEDAGIARGFSPENPAVRETGVATALAAALLAGRGGRTEQQRDYMAQAARDVAALERLPQVPSTGYMLMMYYHFAGDTAAELRAAREGAGRNPGWAGNYAMALDRAGRTDEALRVIDRLDPKERGKLKILQFEAFLLAGQPDAPERLARNSRRQYEQPGLLTGHLYAPIPLLLAGRRADAIDEWRRMQGRNPDWPHRNGWYRRLLDYACGDLTAEQLLAAGGSSRLNLCEAHTLIGLMSLSRGDRGAALEHFRECVATDVFFFGEYETSLSALNHLVRDPHWPPSVQ